MKRYSLIILLVLLGITGDLRAQDARNGTNAAAELQVPIDARYLGGAGAAALANGMESVLWNPAGLDQGTGNVMVMLSHRQHIADIGVNFAGVGMRFGQMGAIAFNIRSFAIGEIEVTDEFNSDGTGESFEPTFFVLGATYGRAMTDRIRIGLTTNLVYENFANVGASGVTFDAGVQYSDFLSLNGLSIGVAIRNIGTSMRYDGSGLFRQADDTQGDRPSTNYKVAAAAADMPTVVDIAVSYSPMRNLQVGATYMENTYGPSELRALASYDFMGYLTVRGAYNFAIDEDEIEIDDNNDGTIEQTVTLENIWAKPSVGASLNLQQAIGMNLSLDYGFMPVEYFDANHVFTIRGSF